MHAVTRAVRELYEQFPYPSGPVTLRIGYDVRRALATIEPQRAKGTPLRVLDAGCSRGVGLIGMAQAQPDIEFVGIDVNGVALAQAANEVKQRGLSNVSLAEVDLETLEGLEVPEGGFDFIVCSGVIHHLVDPVAGLTRLRETLAPHGVLDLMVYAKAGRVGLERVAAAIEQAIPKDQPVHLRLAQARGMAAAYADGDAAWAEAASLDDVEFVDRYLHPCFVSYDLNSLAQLVDGADLGFVGWANRSEWDPSRLGPAAAELHPAEVNQALENALVPRTYDLLLAHKGVNLRAPIARGEVDATAWALNGEGVLESGVRTFWNGARPTGYTWRHRSRDPIPLAQGPAALAAPFLASIGRPFRGIELIRHMLANGVPADTTRQLLQVLESVDMLWRPHEVDLADVALPLVGR